MTCTKGEGEGVRVRVRVGEFTLENDPSRFIRHVSTLAKESSSGMIRIKNYINQ